MEHCIVARFTLRTAQIGFCDLTDLRSQPSDVRQSSK